MLPGFPHCVQNPGQQRSQLNLVQFAMGELRYCVAHLVVPNDVGEAVERAPGLVGNSCGVARIGEPLASPPRYLRSGQPLTHHGSGEEVLLHEARERFADLVLLPRDDRGVRDRNPQWVSE